MFSDHLITIAGHSITITSHDILMTAVSLVLGLVFWAALYFSRKRVVVLKRSSESEQLTLHLSRIADALERLADHSADRSFEGMRIPQQRESSGIAYSMFGR